jgi:hypothetical protein
MGQDGSQETMEIKIIMAKAKIRNFRFAITYWRHKATKESVWLDPKPGFMGSKRLDAGGNKARMALESILRCRQTLLANARTNTGPDNKAY